MAKSEEHISDAEAGFVMATLEHDQLAVTKKAAFPRRKLGGGELLILWALRVYVIFMMAVVCWQAWTATR